MFVIFNVSAGHDTADAVRAAIETACSAAGRDLHLMVVEDPQALPALAREAVERAVQTDGIVVAAGGDGTVNAVARATLGSGCALGVLPQGTFNYFSRTHGIPDDTVQALQVLLHGTARTVQVGLVNQQAFLVNASLGLYPKLLEDREAWTAQLGRSRLVAFGAGIGTLVREYRPLRLQIQVHGELRSVRTLTLFVGNNALQMEQLGFPEACAIDTGELAGILLKSVSRITMLGLLLRGALGRLGASEQVENFSFHRLTVQRTGTFGARRIKLAIDGEISWQTLPLLFQISPQPLLLICPDAHTPARSTA